MRDRDEGTDGEDDDDGGGARDDDRIDAPIMCRHDSTHVASLFAKESYYYYYYYWISATASGERAPACHSAVT